jgi:hypothetical protein
VGIGLRFADPRPRDAILDPLCQGIPLAVCALLRCDRNPVVRSEIWDGHNQCSGFYSAPVLLAELCCAVSREIDPLTKGSLDASNDKAARDELPTWQESP